MADPIAGTGEKRGRRGAAKAAAASTEPAEGLAKGSAGDVLEPLKESVEAASEAAQRGAVRVGDQVRQAAESLLREQKQRVADAVHGFADALRQAAGTFERDEKRMAARYVDQAAAQIDRFSETMRRQSLQDMLASAEDIARRQPALFLTGAVAIGFVVGRVLSRPSDGRAQRAEAYAMTTGESSYYHAGAAPQSGAATGPEPS
jgi:ElaB/YqjD/DUF883 family membrane-anchored ribosome-binding protein